MLTLRVDTIVVSHWPFGVRPCVYCGLGAMGWADHGPCYWYVLLGGISRPQALLGRTSRNCLHWRPKICEVDGRIRMYWNREFLLLWGRLECWQVWDIYASVQRKYTKNRFSDVLVGQVVNERRRVWKPLHCCCDVYSTHIHLLISSYIHFRHQ